MSSLKATYQSYLTSPNASAFASDGSLNYITTLTTIYKADAIAKHLLAHQKTLRKKHENILNTIESNNALCLEVETTIEFLTGGGSYLPGLDDNFLVDQVVTIPVVHIVHFDASHKIQQIRLFWDQGCLLKQIEVIGSRGKNWPIRDGKDHVKLITSSAAAAASSDSSRPTMNEGPQDPNEVVIRSNPTQARKTASRDPHASLSLFAPRDDDYEASQKPTIAAPRGSAKPPPRDLKELFGDDDVTPPRSPQRSASPKKNFRPGSKDQSAKPAPRDYHDIFVGGGDEDASSSTLGRPASPQKENASIAPKTGAGKNFKPNRLFEDTAEQPATPGAASPDKARKPHPTKFNHFEFSDEHAGAPGQTLPGRPKTKHQSQWGFEDFSTPEKVAQKIRSQDIRHFGWGDDDSAHESPAKNQHVPHSRPDAKSHFDFLDDATPPGAIKRAGGPPRGHAADRGAGLYEGTLFNEDNGAPPSLEKKAHPLSTVTNLKDRCKDFDPQFEVSDQSPSSKDQGPNRAIGEARTKAVKMMDKQWEASDMSPESAIGSAGHLKRGPVGKENKGIKTGGDGMGGRKDAVRSWGFGDESDEDQEGGVNGGKFRPERRQQGRKDVDLW
ncbi:MAG: hypothetical protein LQ352_001404 [Teloschistes flavicans]|nr:MAG: hypothetical protein LQ352_001404 [Teloschistes flavicans]